MTRTSSLLTSLAFVSLLGLMACGGSEGAVCQLSTDCSAALTCCKGSTSLTDRGTCKSVCSATDAGPRDMSVTDLGSEDSGGSDLGSEDSGGSDLGSEDLGSPDLGAVDAGEPDGGVSEDLGIPDMSIALDLL